MYPLYGVELEAFAQHGLRVRGEPARGVKKCHSDGGKVSERACQTRWCSLKVLLLLNSLYAFVAVVSSGFSAYGTHEPLKVKVSLLVHRYPSIWLLFL